MDRIPPRQLQRERERFRQLGFSGTFRQYLVHRGILQLNPRRVGTQIPNVGRVIADPIDPTLWPQGTIHQQNLPETNRYKRERRWIYNPTLVWDDQPPPPPPGPPPPPPPPAAQPA